MAVKSLKMYEPRSKRDITHYKYKRRYRKNGKWRYVYEDNSMSDSGTLTTDNGTYNETVLKKYSYGKELQQQPVTFRTEYKTNPNRLFTREYTTSKEKKDETKRKKDIFSRPYTGNHRYETRHVEYGRLHIAKMNTQRRVESIAKNKTVRKVANFYYKRYHALYKMTPIGRLMNSRH